MNASRTSYCCGLNAERIKRGRSIGEPPEQLPGCPSISELTFLVGSSNGQNLNRLTLHADPYVVGSYAEGAYEIDLPVHAAVLDAVKPEYRVAFGAQ